MANTSSQYLTDQHKMAAPLEPDKTAERTAAGGYLFTPPENTVDSFSYDEEQNYANQALEGWRKTVSLPPISQTPPESPQTNILPSITSATGHTSHDSPLFPQRTAVDPTRAQTPLFESDPAEESSPAQPASSASNIPRPASRLLNATSSSRNTFPAILGITTTNEAIQYYEDRMAELYSARHLPTPTTSRTPSILDPVSRRQLDSLKPTAGITKSRSSTKMASRPKAAVATSPVKTSPPKRRSAPKARSTSYNEFFDAAFPPREPSAKHKRAPPSKKVEGENVNWTELPDYAPPTSDLDSNPNKLKGIWHGSALDLRDDPDVQYMHPQEVTMASTLRLTGATYLTNKRKIFQARLQSLKDGKNFTKTAAQSACKIDVNKASQLWEAFDKVGWFAPEWYKQYL